MISVSYEITIVSDTKPKIRLSRLLIEISMLSRLRFAPNGSCGLVVLSFGGSVNVTLAMSTKI